MAEGKSSSNINYYKVLGLNKSCTNQDIKKTYHKLALQYHPDKNQDKKLAEERFHEINSAYNVLGNQRNRNIYDNYGQEGLDFKADCDEMAKDNSSNRFYQKGFDGGESSAFETFMDIMCDREKPEEKPKSKQKSTAPENNFNAKMSKMMNSALFSESEDDSFCKNYIPTFMTESFNDSMNNLMKDCTFTEVFSYSTTVTSDGQSQTSKTRKCVIRNATNAMPHKDLFRDGDSEGVEESKAEMRGPKMSKPNFVDESGCNDKEMDASDFLKGLAKESKSISKVKVPKDPNQQPKSKKGEAKKVKK